MITRRAMFQVCAGVAATPTVLAGTTGANRIEVTSAHALGAVLTDASTDSRAFGVAVRARGLPAHEIGPDLADVYCRDLQPLWRDAPAVPVGGLTGAAPLFYIERLAWDAGLRIVYLGRHEVGANGEVQHQVKGPRH